MPQQQTKCYQSADFLFGEAGVNISDMVSKSRGEYAYAIFDVVAPVSDEFEKVRSRKILFVYESYNAKAAINLVAFFIYKISSPLPVSQV